MSDKIINLLVDIDILQNRKNNINNLLKLINKNEDINYPWVIFIGNTYDDHPANKLDKRLYDGNLYEIGKITTDENIYKINDRDRKNTLISFDNCCNAFHNEITQKPILLFMFGHGCEVSGDMRYFTSGMDINSVTNTSISVTELAVIHKKYYPIGLPIYIIWDVCRVERIGIPYNNFNLADTRSIILIPVARGHEARGGNIVWAGFFTFMFCGLLKHRLNCFNNFNNYKFLIVAYYCLLYYEKMEHHNEIPEIYVSNQIIKSFDEYETSKYNKIKQLPMGIIDSNPDDCS